MLKSGLKRAIPESIRRLPLILATQRHRRSERVEVPDTPHFDAEAMAYFHERIARCAVYLEYGSGGSTVAVARRGLPFTSVESDRRYLAAVQAKIREATGGDRGHYLAVNIGMVRERGFPVLMEPTRRRVAKWRAYPWAPWPMEPPPDVVLVDGRFRVACALVSIRNLYNRADFDLLFDDYRDRPFYHALEEFARLDAMHGGMAVFKQKPVSLEALDAGIERFVSDYR